jgi:hypothetical protein
MHCRPDIVEAQMIKRRIKRILIKMVYTKTSLKNTSTWTPWAEDIMAGTGKDLQIISISTDRFESKQAEGSSPCDVGGSGASHLTGKHNRISFSYLPQQLNCGKIDAWKITDCSSGVWRRSRRRRSHTRIREKGMQGLLIKKDGVDGSNSTAVTLSGTAGGRALAATSTVTLDGSL